LEFAKRYESKLLKRLEQPDECSAYTTHV